MNKYQVDGDTAPGAASAVLIVANALTEAATANTGPVEAKHGNPKDVVGSRKAPLSTLSRRVMHEIALGMLEGECKYWRHNYRASKVRAMVYIDAHDRHISAWVEGQDIDPASGLSHLTKAMCCLAVVRDAELYGSLIDDRPPAQTNLDWMAELDATAAAIISRLDTFERGAFTEANRADWPAMCDALSSGPIKKA